MRYTAGLEGSLSQGTGGMDLNIGRNIIRNSSGVLKVQGKEQVVLELGPEGTELLLTMDLYDSTGTRIAHVRRNVWAFNREDRFKLTIRQGYLSLYAPPPSLTLIDTHTEETVLEALVIDKLTVHILQGKWCAHAGDVLQITPHFWRLAGSVATFGTVNDARGGPVEIG
ncbi:MAG: hypothetical protein ACREIS_12845 [Nitrospiraceae bacterium]